MPSARVRRNDWGRLSPPEIGHWTPTRSVSVVIPAYNCQATLDLTLAGLSAQTYPSALLEVLVVDDGSEPALVLPDQRPDNCRVVRVADHSKGWGRSNALHVGAEQSSGEIVHWLDADMIPFPRHVEAQARWHDLIPDAVTLGYKRFVNRGSITADEVVRRSRDGTISTAFPAEDTEPHGYVEQIIDRTNGLRAGDHLNFLAHVGATASLRRDFYFSTGGLNPELHLGEDTEFGFRLAQAGAVFIPEPAAGSWHMGPSSMTRRGDDLRRFNHPYLADLMPQPRWLRPAAGRTYAVPLVTAVVDAIGSFELVRACVDRLLAGDPPDIRVHLVGPWDTILDERRSILSDPLLDLRLVAATYGSDSRVVLAPGAPKTVYPSPYRLNVPPTAGLGPLAVSRLVAEADNWRVGLVRCVVSAASGRSGPGPTVELLRTAAVSRALRVARPGESLVDAVADVHGQRWVAGRDVDIVPLADPPTRAAADPRLSRARRGVAAGSPDAVPLDAVSLDAEDVFIVGGVRSLLQAARMVAKRTIRHALSR